MWWWWGLWQWRDRGRSRGRVQGAGVSGNRCNITVVILLVKRHPYTPFPLLGPIAGLYAYIEDVC